MIDYDVALILRLLSVVLFVISGVALEIDNEVTGSMVECMADKIMVNFETRNDFGGRIYIKGMVEREDCVRTWGGGARPESRTPSIMFRFGECNMRRARQVNPIRGMMQSIVVVISFHPIFLTKVDRAFKVQCFYMEQDKIVTANLDVSMLTTDSLRDAAAMPSCTYSVRTQSRNGPAVRFARVGQPVYHVWQCDSPSHDMLIKNCFVDDGRGNRYEIIDSIGCALDPVIMPDLIYESTASDMPIAWVEAHVFKFADQSNVFFKCVMQLCNRGETQCHSVTPPTCASRSRRGLKGLVIRINDDGSVNDQSPIDELNQSTLEENEVDLIANPIKVLDLEDSLQQRATLPQHQDDFAAYIDVPYIADLSLKHQHTNTTVCLSPAMFGTLIAIIVLVLFISMVVAVMVCLTRVRYQGDQLNGIKLPYDSSRIY